MYDMWWCSFSGGGVEGSCHWAEGLAAAMEVGVQRCYHV